MKIRIIGFAIVMTLFCILNIILNPHKEIVRVREVTDVQLQFK